MRQCFPGVFEREGKLYTKNWVPGQQVYGETLVVEAGVEYRSWNPYKSKLAAAIMNGLQNFPLSHCSTVLYLGAATGTTVSHLSDIATQGLIYAVEIASGAMRKLLLLCRSRPHLVPILGDAGKPRTYRAQVGQVDLLYQDIAQRDQVDIFCKNMALFRPAWGMIMVKARSIDVGRHPHHIFREAERSLGQLYHVQESVSLDPYCRDHRALLIRSPGLGQGKDKAA
ncbi:MAG: fibrillarin-like rRNA/tRNA 2'-O-methyltransferase [Thermoplasmatota archaeon]